MMMMMMMMMCWFSISSRWLALRSPAAVDRTSKIHLLIETMCFFKPFFQPGYYFSQTTWFTAFYSDHLLYIFDNAGLQRFFGVIMFLLSYGVLLRFSQTTSNFLPAACCYVSLRPHQISLRRRVLTFLSHQVVFLSDDVHCVFFFFFKSVCIYKLFVVVDFLTLCVSSLLCVCGLSGCVFPNPILKQVSLVH